MSNKGGLKELSHGIFSYFGHVRNYFYIQGNLKIVDHYERKTLKIIINLKGTRMVKDGEDRHELQTTNLKNLGKPRHGSCK